MKSLNYFKMNTDLLFESIEKYISLSSPKKTLKIEKVREMFFI